MRPSRALTVAAVALAFSASLTACGSDNKDPQPGSDDNETPVIIEITESGGSITPSDGHVVKVDKDQTIQLVVTTDVDDEIHVHSEPEHEFEVKADETETFKFSISLPGSYPVESHGLDVTLVKLQVS